jgi:hypothetical protein
VACLLRRYPDNALLASDVASVDWQPDAYLIISTRVHQSGLRSSKKTVVRRQSPHHTYPG